MVRVNCFLLPAGLHRGDDDQVDAVGDEHLHRQPGDGRHARHALLRSALGHLGRHQHLDLRIPDVQDCYLHPGKAARLLGSGEAGLC